MGATPIFSEIGLLSDDLRHVPISRIHRGVAGVPARVRLTLDVQGDSVIGNWQLISADGVPVTVPQRSVHGHALNAKFRVETEPNESVMRDNSGEHIVKTTTVLEFTVSGDELSGTRAVLGADGSGAGEARPFKAVREKS